MRKAAIAFTPAEVATYYSARIPNLKQTQSSHWRGPCPLHHGEHYNFAVERETGRWFCHSGCQRGGDIVALERELMNTDFKTARDEVFRIIGRTTGSNGTQPNGSRRWHPVAIYVYRDESEAPLFRVIRRERGLGADREKAFYIEHFEHGQWAKGLGAARRVPYHLPELLRTDQIFICEGEKAADTVVEWGLTGTTNPLGAGKWTPEYSPLFNNKHVVILADNDDAGRAHATQVATALLPVAVSIRILELPDLPVKGDVTDWKAAGGTRERLVELANLAERVSATGLEELIRRWTPDRASGRRTNKHQYHDPSRFA